MDDYYCRNSLSPPIVLVESLAYSNKSYDSVVRMTGARPSSHLDCNHGHWKLQFLVGFIKKGHLRV